MVGVGCRGFVGCAIMFCWIGSGLLVGCLGLFGGGICVGGIVRGVVRVCNC